MVEKLRLFGVFLFCIPFCYVPTAPFDVQKYTFGQTLRFARFSGEHCDFRANSSATCVNKKDLAFKQSPF